MDERPDSPTPDQRPADAPNASGTPEQRLELAVRLLAQQFHAARGEITLLPGRLPDDLPLPLPLPDGARVVGAMTHTWGPAVDVTTILIDTTLSAEQSAQFYSQRLEPLGWAPRIMPHERGGFVHVWPGSPAFRRFTSGEGGYALSFTALPGVATGETTVQVVVQKEQESDEQRAGMKPERMRDVLALIPPLLPPSGASQQPGGGGGGGGTGRWYSIAQMESTQPVAEVIAHYDEQLERGGWRRRDGGASGPVGWSFWSFADTAGAPWRGVLLALNSPDHPRDYLLLVQIESEGESDARGSGFFSRALLMGG